MNSIKYRLSLRPGVRGVGPRSSECGTSLLGQLRRLCSSLSSETADRWCVPFSQTITKMWQPWSVSIGNFIDMQTGSPNSRTYDLSVNWESKSCHPGTSRVESSERPSEAPVLPAADCGKGENQMDVAIRPLTEARPTGGQANLPLGLR